MKKEEVIGKTIITITNNRDKDKTQLTTYHDYHDF